MTDNQSIDVRLGSLPRKIGVPFQDLLSRGYITEQILTTVLDAGDLAEDSSRLMGFAIGYMHLRQSGVPITDVITMSRDLGRKIRLDWSINRWKAEHDRLSRAQALLSLSNENVAYDLSAFDAVIPPDFPGYLIRSSRRLGMEGLRQRHCVASYHSQLLRKYCAIASVFLDKQRWTVQLQLTGRPDRPLRISQIRTRLNKQPESSTRDAIHHMFGIAVDDRLVASASTRPPRPGKDYVYMRNLRRVLPILRQHGVDQVTVTFDGSGDSGCVDGCSYKPDDVRVGHLPVSILVASQQYDNGDWLTTYDEKATRLDQAIEDITDEYLDFSGVDYVNNSGGFGELLINVDRGSVFIEVNARIEDSSCEFSEESDIETGDPI